MIDGTVVGNGVSRTGKPYEVSQIGSSFHVHWIGWFKGQKNVQLINGPFGDADYAHGWGYRNAT